MPSNDVSNLAMSVHKRAEGAAESLVRGYQDQLYSYALRLLRNPMDAQEVTQDAFIRAINALTLRYDTARCRELSLRPWLYRITRNLAFNRGRARGKSPEVPLEPGSNGHRAALMKAGRQREEVRSSGELEFLAAALGQLNRESRELILLRFMEEMSYDDIGKTVGTTAASARAKVFRALRKMRKILARMENRNAM